MIDKKKQDIYKIHSKFNSKFIGQIEEGKIEDNLLEVLETIREIKHEMAQPLTVLIGRCELLNVFCDQNFKMKVHIKSILQNATRISEIAKKLQLLDKQIMNQYSKNDITV